MDSSQPKPWACYCLVSQSGSTYIGSTVDVDRRLRQHNGELVGGAFATKRGSGWRRVCHIVGFPDERAALQFEWRWKQLSRKEVSKNPMERRIRGLTVLLNLEKATSAALPFADFEGPLQIHLELLEYKSLFEGATFAHGILLEN
jgi:predicted GIY-YIG superfamily endonuclease